MIHVEAVTICIDYADFLADAVAANRPTLGRWIVVTLPRDEATHELCRKHDIEIAHSSEERIHAYGSKWNKAALMNDGIERCEGDGWLLSLDADIMLPGNWRDGLELDRRCLYAARRRIFMTRSDWKHGVGHTEAWMKTPRDHACGYFQLFHPSHFIPFDEGWQDASEYDLVFRDQWLPENIHLLPFEVAHLGPTVKNWAGRVSEKWA